MKSTTSGTNLLRGYFEANRLMLTGRDELPTTILNTFLGVALWGHNNPKDEPLTIQELSDKVGLPYTTVSRHLRYLGEMERVGKPGYGLVDTEVYVLNRRQKIVKLTPKGRNLVDQLRYILGERHDGTEEGDIVAG